MFFFALRSEPPAEGGGASPARTITMYNGGFTVDDGPFRRLDDPANKDFLRDLAEGWVCAFVRSFERGPYLHRELQQLRKQWTAGACFVLCDVGFILCFDIFWSVLSLFPQFVFNRFCSVLVGFVGVQPFLSVSSVA